ncbi:MAG TPA: response regulator transcription factor [Nitrospira sp.]|jgi:DNA-binding NarL/FixJ family response regulator|nr:response regulator transcription factor [Nitrospira sp.]MCC7472164.1 response regulator transcription factor [Candidatus Nomurabacteria bacterium]MBS0161680.1 response regulator transcription factor [Nitrospira sp.]MBS0173516.1 response regulator transcription factor [Nitrospira sp.]MBS0179446.1 response regulator transcription factor [Nitrospira sp.]
MNSCRCLIADDHPIVRRGVRELLEEEQLCSEICEVRTGEEALDAVRRLPWDLMILDIALPDKHGLEVLKEAKLLQPRLPVLMLSLYPEKEFAMRAIKAGASGYLTKQSAPSELLAAVLRVLQGGRYITAALAEQMASAIETGADESLHASLSDRELQVLRLLGQGKSVSMIAEELRLSVKTISTYRARILQKLSCESTGELIRYAIEARLID